MSRAELSVATGLTKPTVSRLIDELVGGGLVDEGEACSHGTGRPRIPLMPTKSSVLGVGCQVAWKEVACVAMGLSGEIIAERHLSLDAPAMDYRELVSEFSSVIAATVGEAMEIGRSVGTHDPRLAGMCLAVPGRLMHRGRVVRSAPILRWFDVSLAADVEAELSGVASVEGLSFTGFNDNQLAVLEEIDRRPGESFLYLRGDTGVGGAVVHNGRMEPGHHGWAGEMGHTVVQLDGKSCRCGRRGCIEAYISRRALQELGRVPPTTEMAETLNAVFFGAEGEEHRDTLGRLLGVAIANALNVVDFRHVVLAGYLAPLAALVEEPLQRTIDEHALSSEAGGVTVERSEGSATGALHGAARMALNQVFAAPSAWV